MSKNEEAALAVLNKYGAPSYLHSVVYLIFSEIADRQAEHQATEHQPKRSKSSKEEQA